MSEIAFIGINDNIVYGKVSELLSLIFMNSVMKKSLKDSIMNEQCFDINMKKPYTISLWTS